jgi:hypothetical protein
MSRVQVQFDAADGYPETTLRLASDENGCYTPQRLADAFCFLLPSLYITRTGGSLVSPLQRKDGSAVYRLNSEEIYLVFGDAHNDRRAPLVPSGVDEHSQVQRRLQRMQEILYYKVLHRYPPHYPGAKHQERRIIRRAAEKFDPPVLVNGEYRLMRTFTVGTGVAQRSVQCRVPLTMPEVRTWVGSDPSVFRVVESRQCPPFPSEYGPVRAHASHARARLSRCHL